LQRRILAIVGKRKELAGKRFGRGLLGRLTQGTHRREAQQRGRRASALRTERPQLREVGSLPHVVLDTTGDAAAERVRKEQAALPRRTFHPQVIDSDFLRPREYVLHVGRSAVLARWQHRLSDEKESIVRIIL